jgi:hypothetical protein
LRQLPIFPMRALRAIRGAAWYFPMSQVATSTPAPVPTIVCRHCLAVGHVVETYRHSVVRVMFCLGCEGAWTTDDDVHVLKALRSTAVPYGPGLKTR